MRRIHPRPATPSHRTLVFVLIAIAVSLASCSRAPVLAPDDAFRQRIGATNAEDEIIEIVVTLAPGADAGQVARDNGGALVSVSGGYAVMQFPPFDLPEKVNARVSSDPRVITSEPNEKIETAESRQRAFSFDDGFGSASTYAAQPAAAAIRLAGGLTGGTGAGVVVAILDTGVDPGHPMLAGSIIGGHDFVDNDADFTDTRDMLDNDDDGYIDEAYGHGTHVAGIVHLTAPGARLLIVRVMDADGRGDVRTVAAGIRWATDHGARVINMSLGMMRASQTVRHAILDADAAGIVCVASAGNRGTEYPVEYPAVFPEVLAVAAVNATGTAADFSSFGTYVAVSAPGVGIRSTFPGGGYRIWSGTSMSTAFISGAAALVLGNHPDWRRPHVASRLRTAEIAALDAGRVGKMGSGIIDLAETMQADISTTLAPEGSPLEWQRR